MNPSKMLDDLYQQYGIDTNSLSPSLQQLVKRFNTAFDLLDKADKLTYNKLIPVLIQTSAVIAAELPKYAKPVDASKLRMLELEAKARARKLKLENPEP